MIKVGDTYTYEFKYTQEQVKMFAEVTGDNNPIHLDEEYAATTPFKKPIIHGFLSGCVFSKVFGTLFPGEGSIYLGQTMSFMRPMFVDTAYEATFEVKEIISKRNTAIITTQIKDLTTNKVTLKGEGTVMHKDKIA